MWPPGGPLCSAVYHCITIILIQFTGDDPKSGKMSLKAKLQDKK